MPDIQITITKELQEALDAIEELGAKFRSKIDGLQLPSTDRRAVMSLAMAAAAIEYAESVAILCRAGNSKPAEALLRPLQEGWISLAYILQEEGEGRIFASAAKEAADTAETASLIKEYLENKGKQKLGGFTVEALKSIIEKKTRDKQAYKVEAKKLGSSEKYPEIWQRAKKYDAGNAGAPPDQTAYYNYLVVYRLLSGSVHLGVDGLRDWIEISETGIHLNTKETAESAQRATYTAFALVSDIVTLVLTEIGQGDEDLVNWAKAKGDQIARGL